MEEAVSGLNPNIGRARAKGVPHENISARTTNRSPAALTILALIGFSGVLFLFNPGQHHFYPACLFHKLTGLLCPGCGSLRAAHQLLHGNLIAAFHFNPLFVLSLPFLSWMAVHLAAQSLNRRSPNVCFRPFWIWTMLAVAVLFGVLRNLPFAWPGQ